MKTHEIKGFLLQATRLTHTKWRLSLFSRETGRVTAWMRVGAKAKHHILEPFLPLWFVTQTRGPWVQVLHIEMDALPTSSLVGNALLSGWYLNELLLYLLVEHDAEPIIYDAYLQTLDFLRSQPNRSDLEIALRQFEWLLLQSLGYAISLTMDARSLCPIVAEKYYRCIPGEGLVEASVGLLGESCLALSQGEWSNSVLKDAKQLMRSLIDHLLEGRELKTRELYRSMHVQQ